MPYSVEQRGTQWVVVKDSTGEVMGRHPTRAAAEAQRRALYANEAMNTHIRRAAGR